MTRPDLKSALCNPVRRRDGKCIVGGSKQVVEFENGEQHVVLRRRLRVVNVEGGAPVTRDATGEGEAGPWPLAAGPRPQRKTGTRAALE